MLTGYSTRKSVNDDEKIRKPLLSTSGEGQEIIRQFVEQGMIDARCQIIAVVVPQYIDAGFKGTLRHLARLSGKKVTFIELDELSELISINKKILVSKCNEDLWKNPEVLIVTIRC